MPNKFPNIKKVLTLSIAALLAQVFVLNRGAYQLFKIPVQSIFSITPVTGIGGAETGNTILGYISGYIPFDFSSIALWFAMFIGTFLITYGGYWFYESFGHRYIWNDKNLIQRIIAILAYGHVILFAVLWLLQRNVPNITINLIIGLGVNLILLSTVIGIGSKLGWPKI